MCVCCCFDRLFVVVFRMQQDEVSAGVNYLCCALTKHTTLDIQYILHIVTIYSNVL